MAVGKGGLRLEGAEASEAVLANLENQIHMDDLDIKEELGYTAEEFFSARTGVAAEQSAV